MNRDYDRTGNTMKNNQKHKTKQNKKQTKQKTQTTDRTRSHFRVRKEAKCIQRSARVILLHL